MQYQFLPGQVQPLQEVQQRCQEGVEFTGQGDDIQVIGDLHRPYQQQGRFFGLRGKEEGSHPNQGIPFMGGDNQQVSLLPFPSAARGPPVFLVLVAQEGNMGGAFRKQVIPGSVQVFRESAVQCQFHIPPL